MAWRVIRSRAGPKTGCCSADDRRVMIEFATGPDPAGNRGGMTFGLSVGCTLDPSQEVCSRALVACPDPDVEGNTGRRRGAQPRAPAAGGHDPPARRRDLHLHAAGPAGAPQGRPDRPRGDGRRRGAGAPDARAPAGRALEGVGPLRGLRRPPDEAHDQRRPPDGPRADPRGSDHRHGPRPGPVVQAAADHALPDPDQVPRRAAAPVRDRADPRVPDEGRLQHRRRPRPAQLQLRQDVRGLLPDLRPLRAPLRDRRGRERADRRRLVARVHGPLLDRRGHGHLLRQVRLRGQPGARRGRRPRPSVADARRPGAGLPGRADPRQADDPRGLRVPRGRGADLGQAAGLPGRRQAGRRALAGRPRAQRGQVPPGGRGDDASSRPTRRRSRRPPGPRWASSARWGSRSRW